MVCCLQLAPCPFKIGTFHNFCDFKAFTTILTINDASELQKQA